MKNRNGWHLFLRNELDFYPNRGIIGRHNAGVAERQTRWFQVPVLRDVWVQIPSPAPMTEKILGHFLFSKWRSKNLTFLCVSERSESTLQTALCFMRHIAERCLRVKNARRSYVPVLRDVWQTFFGLHSK